MNRDSIVFDKPFNFDSNVSECFTDMISRSIPGYDLLGDLVYRLGKNFVVENATILDVGCSNGIDVLKFIKEYHDTNNFILIDNNPDMIKKSKELIKSIVGVTDRVKCKIRDLISYDLRDVSNVSLGICLFLLQFIPLEDRQQVLQNIFNTLIPGGALIVAEKYLPKTSFMSNLFRDEYYNIKRDNGYSLEQIYSKRNALKTVMYPVSESMTKDMLIDCGFSKVETFWKCLNFCGFIAIK